MFLNDNFSAFLLHAVCQLSMYKAPALASTTLTHLSVQCTRKRGSATTSFQTASISDRRAARNARSPLVSAFTMHNSASQFSMLPYAEEMHLPNSRQPLPNHRIGLLLQANQPKHPTNQLHKIKTRRVSIEFCDELKSRPNSVRRKINWSSYKQPQFR